MVFASLGLSVFEQTNSFGFFSAKINKKYGVILTKMSMNLYTTKKKIY